MSARSSNTGADALSLAAKYAHSAGSSDPAGTARITVTRAATGMVWDSGWVGNPTMDGTPPERRT